MFNVNSAIERCWSGVRSQTGRILMVTGLAVLASMPSTAFAQAGMVCGPEVKEAVAKALAGVDGATDAEKARVQQDLYAKYYPVCAQDAKFAPSTFVIAAQECGAAPSNVGSLFFEEM